jgi:hypothetical protein
MLPPPMASPGPGGMPPGIAQGLSKMMMGGEGSVAKPNSPPPWSSEAPEWGKLGIIRPQAAANLTEEVILEQIRQKKQAAKEARKRQELKWEYLEDSYACRIRNNAKKAWQSNLVVPDVQNTVRSFVSLNQAGLFASNNWMRLMPFDQPYPDGFLHSLESWMRYVAQRGGLQWEWLKAASEASLLGTSWMMVSIDDIIKTTPRLTTIPPDPQMMQMMRMQGMPPPPPNEVIETRPSPRISLSTNGGQAGISTPTPTLPASTRTGPVVDEYNVDRDVIEERIMAGVYDSSKDIGEPMHAERRSDDRREAIWENRRPSDHNRKRDRIDSTAAISTTRTAK